MTFEEKLGFEVAKELLDIHNEELQSAEEIQWSISKNMG